MRGALVDEGRKIGEAKGQSILEEKQNSQKARFMLGCRQCETMCITIVIVITDARIQVGKFSLDVT